MKFTRRALVAAAAAAPGLAQAAPAPAGGAGALPARSAFARMPFVYLDSGSTHPMPLGARAALEEYLRYKTRDGDWPGYSMDAKEKAVVEGFGALVGAAPDELTIIQSTTMGENLVLRALGLPEGGGRIVTDALHFFGSFYTYGELGKAGMDVVTLPMTPEGRIDMAAMAAAINDRTRLVSISHVSTTNGFEHDLKAACDLAHAHGAYVYADIVHGAGSTPLDLGAAGVDFAACSSYKWLMGDFGLAFLYVRREVQEKVRRPWWGYHQVGGRFVTHVFPFDPPGETVADYGYAPGANGRFAMGTTSWTGVVQLEHSLGFIRTLGVASIQAWRQPMIDAIQGELRRRGYQPMTPLDSRTPLVAFALKDARAKLGDLLAKNDLRLTVSANRFRVSLSVFNDMNDVDRLLAVLPKAPPA
ncbi:MAG: aminotransferase class V-fold PLP-dependent enzyme [Phenylobacterium sp.]|uniref:aminotransferase class V-fold PLP-dependent enzyme n=1 Tax=Phenylobacterium sp. TaxID=1871053 RepID=UPI001A239BCA|nr:aminotransferase class V-fold PLP-dependent enzyme [Phenylobacterium sp.]MBJ7413351.1 aminotransferase class V-fold PLP-dependent enzyme [Phenylobacterium sp.]